MIELTEKDMKQVSEMGITKEKVLSQIDIFNKGIPFTKLKKACTIGDGITVVRDEDINRLSQIFDKAALSGRMMKFVPASGVASRMFKLLLSFYLNVDGIRETDNSDEYKEFLRFVKRIKNFAFYDDLKSVMSSKGLDIEQLILTGKHKEVLENILDSAGMDYAKRPKGLIKFHRYSEYSRTPVEEHLVEANAYTRDKDNICRIHFTVSPEHQQTISHYIKNILHRYEKSGTNYEITYSTQKASTNTIAVDVNNQPFRDQDGSLVFRPAGHGALLENLNDLNGDIVFIKNIDNVVPDRLKSETYLYKKLLGGYLVELQKEIFNFLEKLSQDDIDSQFLDQVFEFIRRKLYVIPPQNIQEASNKEKTDFLFKKLNRPLRICGMVKFEGEPGGGPFWVENPDQSHSLQIVEIAQINVDSDEQQEILESSTHFNPTDLVCGVRDYTGQPFNLLDFVNPDAGFIATKSKDGRILKAIELPGLWNGSMADWNTVFVKVPIITFNPVKTVNDLLREEHQ